MALAQRCNPLSKTSRRTINHVRLHRHSKKHLEERASVAARLGVAGSSSLLKPGNEGLKSEGLGQLSTAGRSRGCAGSRCSLSDSRGSSRGRGSSGGSSGSGRGSSGSAVAGGGRSRRRAGAGAAGPESRAGDLVVDGGGVGVEDDAVLVGGVEAGADDTLGRLGSGAGDLNVKAWDWSV